MKKIAVVSGASRGLGLALAKEFTGSGWQVVGTGRSPRPHALPIAADYSQFDAADGQACEEFWQTLTNTHPDARYCLVNNAGGYISGGLTGTSVKDYEQQMRSCYFSAVYMTRGLAVTAQKARIINIISSSALGAHKNNSAYGAAKAAEMHFFQSIQQEFAPEQYQITNLYPSDIASSGPNPDAIAPADLSRFVVECAESTTSFYLRDVTMYPRHQAAD